MPNLEGEEKNIGDKKIASVQRSRSIRDFLKRGQKPSSQIEVTKFGTAVNILKNVFKTNKFKVHRDGNITWISESDIELLKIIHAKCFGDGKKLSDIPIGDAYRKSALLDLDSIIISYKGLLALDTFNASMEKEHYKILLQDIDIQKKAIAAYETKVKEYATITDRYLSAMEVIKLLVAPSFTGTLEQILPKNLEIKLKPQRPIYDSNEQKLDMSAPAGLEHQTTTDDPAIMALLDLAGILNIPEPELVVRLSKQAAKRSRNRDDVMFDFNAATQDFNKKCTISSLFDTIKGSVTRLSDQTETKTATKPAGQYQNTPELKATHDRTKIRIYKDTFKVVAKDTEVVIANKNNTFEFLKIKAQSDVQQNISNASISVSGDANKLLATQAILIDELREMSVALGAVSVNISSFNSDGSVNTNNVLKGAFNALHANLVPKFDADTWAAIQAFKPIPFVASANNDDVNAYTGRYCSKQFIDFLLEINPQNKSVIYKDVYSKFTDLMAELNYRSEYTANRSASEHPPAPRLS